MIAAAKLTTAMRVFRSSGVRGVAAIAREKLHEPSARALRRSRNALDAWRQQEHWWLGLIVAISGDRVRLDGCTFSVGHPAIRTSLKSLFLLGQYEKSERDILTEHLDRSMPLVELGGGIGVVACVANSMLSAPEKHVVVEANPELIDALLDSRERNGGAFAVLNRAVAYGGDEVTFYRARGFLAGSVQVASDRPIAVPTITMRQIIAEAGFDTCTLVCDIEGGEMDLVKHESDVLTAHVQMFIVEMHGWRVGQQLADEAIATLQRIGFVCVHQRGATYVFRNTRISGA
jgi:FkbM family methyltransferase